MTPETGTSAAPLYVWKPAGKPISVQMQFDVIDRVLLEVMRGFGAVPKRGAEVGAVYQGVVKRIAGWHTAKLMREFGLNMTGGSSTIKDLWLPMRHLHQNLDLVLVLPTHPKAYCQGQNQNPIHHRFYADRKSVV